MSTEEMHQPEGTQPPRIPTVSTKILIGGTVMLLLVMLVVVSLYVQRKSAEPIETPNPSTQESAPDLVQQQLQILENNNASAARAPEQAYLEKDAELRAQQPTTTDSSEIEGRLQLLQSNN